MYITIDTINNHKIHFIQMIDDFRADFHLSQGTGHNKNPYNFQSKSRVSVSFKYYVYILYHTKTWFYEEY